MKRLLVVLLILGSVCAFSQTFLLSPKSLNNPYWFAAENGMKDAATALGVQAIFDAPIEADAAEQAQKAKQLEHQRIEAEQALQSREDEEARVRELTFAQVEQMEREQHEYDLEL